MKAPRFAESKIVAILKQQDSGQTVTQITREPGISKATATATRREALDIEVDFYCQPSGLSAC